MLRSTDVAARVVGSVVALVGFAGKANASATIDLIWSSTGTNEISNVNVDSTVTLQVILTAGANGSQGAIVNVDYSAALGKLAVTTFMNTPGGPLPIQLSTPTDTGSRIETINSVSIPPSIGIGLTAGQSHQLGTVTFQNNEILAGTLEIKSDANGATDGVFDLNGIDITATTTFNSAFLLVDTDSDGDGIPDVTDNCPFVPNNSQDNSDPLPAGDACQCGDVNNDFSVNALDAQIARENLVGSTLSGSFHPERCNVIGTSDCGVDDIFAIDRVVQSLSSDLQNLCEAYLAP